MLTDGQSDIAGTVRTGGIHLCDRRFGWKIWIFSFQAEPTQTLKVVRRMHFLGKEVGSFLLSNCGETSVETGSLNLEVLKVCTASLRGGHNSNACTQ